MTAKRYILLPFWAIAVMLMVFSGCSKFECEHPVEDVQMEKGISTETPSHDDTSSRGGEDLDSDDGITDDEDDEDDSQRSTNR